LLGVRADCNLFPRSLRFQRKGNLLRWQVCGEGKKEGKSGGKPQAITSGKGTKKIHEHAEWPFYSKALCSSE